jgi:hypothetical protein
MNAKNEKDPAKDFIWMMLFCFILGLITFLFCLGVYWYWGDLQLKADDNDSVPAFIYRNNLAVIRILAFGVLPISGFAFFGVGCKLWKCYRHYKVK